MSSQDFDTHRWMPLFISIAAARGKEVSGATMKALIPIFDEMGEKEANRLVSQIIKYDNIPTNIYGHIVSQWEEIKRRKENNVFAVTQWKAQEGCTTSKEWEWYFRIISEILDWHKNKLVKRNAEGLTTPMDIEEWGRLGCPKTWCPILDHFFSEYLKVHKLQGKGCEEFLQKYYNLLIKSRSKKELQIGRKENETDERA